MSTVAAEPGGPEGAGAAVAPLVELEGLVVDYGFGEDAVRAVNGISLAIHPGEIVGLAGESGCGKSTVASAIMQILRAPGHVAAGSIRFRGEELLGLKPEELRSFRWRNVSLVFQSAMNSLNPVTRVGDQFVDMFKAHEKIRKGEALDRAGDLLELVGIDKKRLRAYPHELSGGMRQRVIIAMALSLQPELLLMDEPTTALDVVVQREILHEIQELQRELGFAVSSSRTICRYSSSSATGSRSCTPAISSSVRPRTSSSNSHSTRTRRG